MQWVVFLFSTVVFLETVQAADLSKQQAVRAAIDFGSGAIKMQVAQVDVEANQLVGAPLVSKQITLNLTEDITANNDTISIQLEQKALSILGQLKDEAIKAAASIGQSEVEFTAIATASFRLAQNGNILLQKFEEVLGIHFQILSQENEGKLGFMTAKALFPEQDEDKLVSWDNGYGSFQMASVDDVYQGPTGFGVVRVLLSRDIREGPILQSHQSGNPVSRQEAYKLILKIQELLPPIPEWLELKLQHKETIVATFGEGKSMFPVLAQSIATLNGETETVEEAVLSLADLYRLCDVYLEQEDELFDAHGTYRNTLLGAIYIITVMEYLGIETISYKRSLGNTAGILISPTFWKPSDSNVTLHVFNN